jgi:Domain of unknown function (DUF4926)
MTKPKKRTTNGGPSLLDVVALLTDLPDRQVVRGQVGTIVEELDEAIELVKRGVLLWPHAIDHPITARVMRHPGCARRDARGVPSDRVRGRLKFRLTGRGGPPSWAGTPIGRAG